MEVNWWSPPPRKKSTINNDQCLSCCFYGAASHNLNKCHLTFHRFQWNHFSCRMSKDLMANMKVCFSSEFVVTQVSFEWVSSQEIVKSTQLYHLSSTQSCYALKWLVSPCHQSGLGRWGKREKWPREPELNSRKKPACWVRWPVYTMLFACEANLFTLFSNVNQKFYVKYNYMR